MVAEINHRLHEVLDITTYWQQDDESRLTVDYKSGFFNFEITDRTGAKYTFNERSSGLKYFLSYYVQAKAIEKANQARGSLVLMDEPDSFLSIAGQRSLLQVFESLVNPRTASGSCQLLYTTHSPFLVNRNFPQRLCLLRKGEGNEGTQYVQRSAIRRYEPIRSALGIDCSETLFMGAVNVVVEGASDQKVIVGAIQRFGKVNELDVFLDLNKIVLVSAGGAPYVRRLIENSLSGDEKRPVVVAMLDGDTPGSAAFQEIVANHILDKDLATTLDQITFASPSRKRVLVLEDIIPASLLAIATSRYLKERWGTDARSEELLEALSKLDSNTMAKAVVDVASSKLGSRPDRPTDVEIKGAIIDTFVDCLAGENGFPESPDLASFEQNIKTICAKLRSMIDEAERRSWKETLHKCVKLIVESFEKSHSVKATRADVERCLGRLELECTGVAPEARRSRENVSELKELLIQEVRSTADQVDIGLWRSRLTIFRQAPWSRPADGWQRSSLSKTS